ncbi:MAG: IS4 family transposase [Bacteroidota bacterium]|nr:IS4 family transposase [Bacteroidota bacterium]
MNKGKYVFAQVASFIDANDFIKCVNKYNGNYRVQHFTCWHQLMCLMFGQLCNRESLSDLITCLDTQKSKWYHLGLGIGISKNNLSNANIKRDWRIFADYSYILIAHARKICVDNADFNLDIEGNVYAVDASTIDLCLEVFWWAKFKKYKGAIKLHTQLDLKTNIPSFIHITDGSVHDVNYLDVMEIEANSTYILDRGYVDFARLYNIHNHKAYFVTRLKTNTNYRRLYSRKVDKTTGLLCDQTIKLNNYYANKKYPEKLRRVKYYDAEINMTFEFVSNNFSVSALQIAQLYKQRWQIELFFKWIKQHLKVKSFWGYTENAVKIQIYTAIITYVTVAIMKQELKIKHSNYEILQILSITLLNKTPVNQLFDKNYLQSFKELNHNQLNLF